MPTRGIFATLLAASLCSPLSGAAQLPVSGEVRQIVTFRFLPGASGEAIGMYRDEAVPLYRRDAHMLSFRGFREAESPVPLDLVVVSAFDGMAGMDASNAALRGLAEEAGTTIGGLYGRLSARSSGHTDEFVRMLPDLGNGDPTGARLTAFFRYSLPPGSHEGFERVVRGRLLPLEAAQQVPAVTGRFLVSDGWDYLRLVGFESLAAYETYVSELQEIDALSGLTTRVSQSIVVGLPELAVR